MVNAQRLWYRVQQFGRALYAPLQPVDVAYAARRLARLETDTGALLQLFERMQRVEQHHGIAVCSELERAGYDEPDLLAAALLHDVGKVVLPLRLWERVWVVLIERFAPTRARVWRNAEPKGLQRGLVVRHHHARWGAELVAQSGGTSRMADLIARHHDNTAGQDVALAALQAADER